MSTVSGSLFEVNLDRNGNISIFAVIFLEKNWLFENFSKALAKNVGSNISATRLSL